MSSVMSDLLETGRTHLAFRTVALVFGKFPTLMLIWLCTKLSTFLVFYAFQAWAKQYETNDQKAFLSKMHNYAYLVAFIAYMIMLTYFPLKAMLYVDLPIVSSLSLLMEQVRLLMKTYAFVRSNVPKVTSGRRPPEISKFLYFLFAPTLIYRDSYPRTSIIRWSFVVWHFTEVVFVIFYQAFLMERMLIPLYRDFGIEPFEIRKFVMRIFSAMLPASVFFISGFYLLLHAWMNAWAEMLRFGDRTFYKDWWNVSSYDKFYRTWNIVVHDWLYTYIYKDLYEFLDGKSKIIPLTTTFVISAMVHEYILAFSLRFLYPSLFISFAGFSLLFVLLSKKFSQSVGNLFVWFTICFGNGVVISSYIIEGFARVNCPPYSDDFWDLIVPRCLTTCYSLSS